MESESSRPAAMIQTTPRSRSGRIGCVGAHLNRFYDEAMYRPSVASLYGDSDFHNLGYWLPGTRSPKEACENLIEILIGFIPRKEGTVLDVACGKGASTRWLCRDYMPENITGVNISEKQLKRCRVNAPGCTFLLMDATKLSFPDASFCAVVCVEAAFHFNSRDRFLREAFRILKPGGYLVLSDILVTSGHAYTSMVWVPANYIRDPMHYRKKLDAIGFQVTKMIDATDECWISFYNHLLDRARKRMIRGEISFRRFEGCRQIIAQRRRRTNYYVIVAALKPS